MEQKLVEKAAEIISAKTLIDGEPFGPVGILALIDLDGYPKASAKSVSKNCGINWLTFCVNFRDKNIKRIEQCNHASVCLFSIEPLYNITLVGKIEVITDLEVKREMWFDDCKNYWTGPEDENLCVLKFVTERYKIFINGEEVEGKI
jgi:general stress protein 26